MKQMTNKMFRGCPYESEEFESCALCPNYEQCFKMKKDKIRKKKLKRMQRFLIRLSVIFINLLCVIGIVYLIILINANNKAKQNNNELAGGSVLEVFENIEENTLNNIEDTEKDILNNIENTNPSTTETINPIEKPTEIIHPKAELSAYGPSDTYYYDISYEDKVIIAKTVWVESRGEPFEGKVAVASVILNRYYSEIPYFNTESIHAVVTQPYQFASIKNVSMENLEQYPDCMKAVEAACKGWDPTRTMFSNGALYFYAPKYVMGYQAEIREGIRVLVIGNHNFHYDFEKVE